MANKSNIEASIGRIKNNLHEIKMQTEELESVDLADCLKTIEAHLSDIEDNATEMDTRIEELEEEQEDEIELIDAGTQLGEVSYTASNPVDASIMGKVAALMANVNPHKLNNILHDLAVEHGCNATLHA